MDIERDIELPFTYSTDIIRTLIIIVILIVLVIVFDKLFRAKIIKIIKKPNIPKLKNKYERRLENLYQKASENRIDMRSGYTELSNIIREFIERATGIKVSSFSKNDAHKLGMDDLGLLMEEYYPPEFSKGEKGDILKSITKTMEVIKRWKEKS